jgi:hypothetical protein
MSEEARARIMREQLPAGNISIVDGDLLDTPIPLPPGYVIETTTAYHDVYSLNNYFDLSGYSLEDKTTFIQACLMQRIGVPNLDGLAEDCFVTEYALLTTTPLSAEEDFGQLLGPDCVPGNLLSTTRLQDIIQGTCVQYTQDVGASFGRAISTSSWGCGDSTAAPRLYYHRFFRFDRYSSGATLATYQFQFPGLAFVVPIVTDKESELEYMMRLSRSLEPVY